MPFQTKGCQFLTGMCVATKASLPAARGSQVLSQVPPPLVHENLREPCVRRLLEEAMILSIGNTHGTRWPRVHFEIVLQVLSFLDHRASFFNEVTGRDLALGRRPH